MKAKWMLVALGMSMLGVVSVRAEEAATEEEKAFSFSADVDLVSKYMWRGLRLNDDFSIQPGVSASAYGLTAALWGQVATKSPSDRTLEEVDFTLSYAHSFGKLEAEGGWIRYMYPGDVDGISIDPTNELFLTASYDHPWAPTAGVFYDLDLKSMYLELNAGPTFEAAPKLSVTPNLTASYYHFDEGDSSTRLEPAVSLSYELGGGLSASGKVAYSLILSPDDAENTFWAGVGLHYSF